MASGAPPVVAFAALEATVNRLSEPSRRLLARLGVLHRPFPLAVLEQGLGVARAEWQPLLDWSLLRYDPLQRTYHLHSVTRRYAEVLLDEQGVCGAMEQKSGLGENGKTCTEAGIRSCFSCSLCRRQFLFARLVRKTTVLNKGTTKTVVFLVPYLATKTADIFVSFQV